LGNDTEQVQPVDIDTWLLDSRTAAKVHCKAIADKSSLLTKASSEAAAAVSTAVFGMMGDVCFWTMTAPETPAGPRSGRFRKAVCHAMETLIT